MDSTSKTLRKTLELDSDLPISVAGRRTRNAVRSRHRAKQTNPESPRHCVQRRCYQHIHIEFDILVSGRCGRRDAGTQSRREHPGGFVQHRARHTRQGPRCQYGEGKLITWSLVEGFIDRPVAPRWLVQVSSKCRVYDTSRDKTYDMIQPGHVYLETGDQCPEPDLGILTASRSLCATPSLMPTVELSRRA
jgi:hypothetical protein